MADKYFTQRNGTAKHQEQGVAGVVPASKQASEQVTAYTGGMRLLHRE
jgi:hypothetical protein